MIKEGLKQIEAFEHFYSLGGKATKENCRRVAETMQMSARTFWNWYKRYNWKEKVEQRNIENSKKIEAKTDKTIVNSKADYRADIKTQLGILKAILNKVIQDFKSNNVLDVDNVKDLEKVINSYEKLTKLDLSIMGEKLDKQEIIININGDTIENNN